MSQKTLSLQTAKSEERYARKQATQPRVAWLFPSLWLGHYWHPIFVAIENLHANTRVFAGGLWDDFDTEAPGTRLVEQVGSTKYHRYAQTDGYSKQVIMPSFSIIPKLLAQRPKVVYTQAFSLWSLLVVLFKGIGGWQVNMFIDGSSPNVDFRDSRLRTFMRRFIVRFTDVFVPNSEAARDYLVDFLGADPDKVIVNRYLMPDAEYLHQNVNAAVDLPQDKINFLYVGKLIPRKGAERLIEACVALKKRGFENFNLVMVGDGSQRQALEDMVSAADLQDQVSWRGWVTPDELGPYYKAADVFVFPTLEDIWGIVALEAMAFGCPVIGSSYAGSSEMIEDGESGFIVDPNDDDAFVNAMQRFVAEPELVDTMGEKAQAVTLKYTPQAAAATFYELVNVQLATKQQSA